ncbi:MAG: DUF4411 family protein [Candidatus Kerfeldbacteria bacterium]
MDSSALIYAWGYAYPLEAFGGFWENLEGLGREGRLLVSEEVLEEVQRKDDGLHKWLKQRDSLVASHTGEVQLAVKEILKSHRLLLNAGTGKSGGDPFVVAVARVHGCCVVSEEQVSDSPKRIKIPNVCRDYRVKCIPLVRMILAEGWRFGGQGT